MDSLYKEAKELIIETHHRMTPEVLEFLSKCKSLLNHGPGNPQGRLSWKRFCEELLELGYPTCRSIDLLLTKNPALLSEHDYIDSFLSNQARFEVLLGTELSLIGREHTLGGQHGLRLDLFFKEKARDQFYVIEAKAKIPKLGTVEQVTRYSWEIENRTGTKTLGIILAPDFSPWTKTFSASLGCRCLKFSNDTMAWALAPRPQEIKRPLSLIA